MITRAQMPRQLRDKGGIASVTPREKYGLGSKIKDRFRKLIPNELADVAVKAAPLVAMIPGYGPATAALMRGIGRFDQRGSISDAFKQGLGTFAGGKLFGAGMEKIGLRDPGAKGIGEFFSKGTRSKAGSLFEGGEKIKTVGKEKTGPLKNVAEKAFENVPFSDKISTKVKEKLLVGGITSGASALYSYFTGEFEPQEPGESLEEYMARRRESVKSQMRQVMDSYYTPLRNPEYAAMSDEQKNNFIDGIVGQGMATGGRVGYQTGGITMANTLAENIRRNLANQAAFQQAINPSKQKIVERLQKANPTTKSALEKFADHARVSEAMAGKTGKGVIPEYGMQTGYDFQKKMSGLNPKISSALAKGYQYAQEGARAILDGPGNVTLKDAMKTAKKQSDENIEGIMKAASGEGLTAKQQADRNKFLADQGQMKEPVMMAETPKEDPTGYDFDSEYYRNNPGSKDFDRFRVAYAKSVGLDDRISVGPDGQVSVNFGSWDPSRTYQAYKSNKQTNYNRPFFYKSSSLSPERTAELEKQENILTSLYGPPGKGKASLAKGGMPVGIMRTNKAGVMERDYRETGGFVPVGIKEKADDVPAMLSKNEFVFTADAVRGAGNGSIEKGAQKMYDTMKKLEKRVT